MNLYRPFNEKVIPCLKFSMEFQSNNLIYKKQYSKRQQIIYVLIQHLHDQEGFGYRKISQWLNKSYILTHTGKKWFSSSVISVLKRKHERDLMNDQIRNHHFPSKLSKFEVNYYIFD
jgi:GTP cyclohydrolase FolE2